MLLLLRNLLSLVNEYITSRRENIKIRLSLIRLGHIDVCHIHTDKTFPNNLNLSPIKDGKSRILKKNAHFAVSKVLFT